MPRRRRGALPLGAGLEVAARVAVQLGCDALESVAARVLPGSLPRDVSDLTPAWLTRVLQPCAEGVVVDRVEALGLESGTSSRARIALAYEAPGTRADLPPTLFVKFAPPDVRTRIFVGVLGLARSEVAFYRTARAGLPVRTPRAYFAAATRFGTRFVLLLEDLAARGCRFADITTASDVPRARSVMQGLARLHAACWESPRLRGDLAWLRGAQQDSIFRTGRFLSEISLRPALARFGDLVPEGLRAEADFVSRQRLALEGLWGRPPLTLIHGDAHVGNLFFDGPDVGFLDWQVVQRGQGMRDVSYFLANSLGIETRRQHDEALIRVYLETLAEAGVPRLPFSVAWEQYRLHVLYAWISAVVTAAAATLQREAIVRAGLERSSAAVMDLDSLGALRECTSG